MHHRVLRTQAAAAYVGLASATLEKLRSAGGGPRFLRIGLRAVGYDVADLDAWLDARRRPDPREPDPETVA